MKLQTWFAGAAIAAAILGAGAAQAQTCVGNCGTDGADGVVTLSPTGNSSYDFVSTAGGVVGAGQISGVGGTNGSQLTSAQFAASAGDPLTLFFNYVTSDGSEFADYAFAELQTSTGAHVAWLFTARTEPLGNTSPGQGLPADDSTLTPSTSAIIAPGLGNGVIWGPLGGSSGGCFDGSGAGCGHTGWIQSTFAIPSAGTYQVEFGVTNFLDQAFDTGLAFDGLANNGITIPTTPGGAVPEPATWAMMLLGLGAMGAMLRTARRNGSPATATA